MESALLRQLLGGKGFLSSDVLVIEIFKVLDTQVVDIGIIGDSLMGEILAEIETVGADCSGKLYGGQVVLQIELCVYAVLLQQRSDFVWNGLGMNALILAD